MDFSLVEGLRQLVPYLQKLLKNSIKDKNFEIKRKTEEPSFWSISTNRQPEGAKREGHFRSLCCVFRYKLEWGDKYLKMLDDRGGFTQILREDDIEYHFRSVKKRVGTLLSYFLNFIGSCILPFLPLNLHQWKFKMVYFEKNI